MKDQARNERNEEMLDQLHKPIRGKFARVLAYLEGAGFKPRIQEAWRSPENQMKAFKSGRSKVTWGYHCAVTANGDPDALAADILDDEQPFRPSSKYVEALRSGAKGQGLEAPFDWDKCHVQVTKPSILDAKRGVRP